MSRRLRAARIGEICAPWVVSGLALSAASAVGVPVANNGGTESRARSTARASAEIREAARITVPQPGEAPRSDPRGLPKAVQRPCRPGDAPEGVACSFTVIDLP